jgi:oxaloacetate decarboxylase
MVDVAAICIEPSRGKDMHGADRRERFRAVLDGARCVHPASVYNPMTARLAADLGYETGMFSGSVASLTILGAPDLVVLTRSEFAGQALRINRTGDLPLMVYADHGYGNALKVERTVEELETARVCGLPIEDTLLPPAFGAPEKPQLLWRVRKMRAALGERQDKRLVIVGRSSSIAITSLSDRIARAKAYEAAAAMHCFLAGAKTRGDIERISAAIRIPLVLGGPSAELQDSARNRLAERIPRRLRACRLELSHKRNALHRRLVPSSDPGRNWPAQARVHGQGFHSARVRS